jgi:hypothetical protein
MIITLSGLRSYARGLDDRFNAYTDEKLNGIIEYAVKNLAVQAQCFYSKEVYPLDGYIDAGLTKFTISPLQDILEYDSVYLI